MHRRRKSLHSKADSAEKKLNKMGPDSKNLRQQTDLLTGLREQIRTIDTEILNEEASLGDWKRIKAREWMGVLFGALLECSETGAVVATFGRTIIGYVSTERTQPGLARAHYSGHAQVEPLVVEAEREIHKVSFVGGVGDGTDQPSEYHIGDIPGLPRSSPSLSTHLPQPYASSTLPANPPSSHPYELNDFGEYNPHSESQSQTYTPGQRPRLSSLDQQSAVGSTISSPFFPFPLPGGTGFTPGHKPNFSQNSVRSGSGFTPGYPPPAAPALYPSHSSNNTSGSGALSERRTPTDDTFSSSIAKALGEGWSLDENRDVGSPHLSADGPPPSYATDHISTSSPPNLQGSMRIERKPVPAHIQEATNEDDDGVGLSYLNPSVEDGPGRRSDEKRLSDSGSGSREDRKVRWGSVRDVDVELEKRYSEEIRKSNESTYQGAIPLRSGLIRVFTVRRTVSPGKGRQTPSPAYRSRSPSPRMPEPHPHVHQHPEVYPAESPTSLDESQPLPNPNMSVEDEGPSPPDEKRLNALAAREISKQMETSAYPLSPPSLPFTGRKSVSPRPSFSNDISPSNDNRFGQITSPPPQFADSMQGRDLTPTPNPSQPPQFQSLPPPPPIGALLHSTSMDSTVSDPTQVDDAYHTPPEYLRNVSAPPSPPVTRGSSPQVPHSSPSLSSSPPTPTTTKKISAAAFRRPGMRGPSSTINLSDPPRQDSLGVGFRPSTDRSPSREKGDDEKAAGIPDVTPLNLRKKSLPAVPGNSANLLSEPHNQGASRSVSSPFPDPRASEEHRSGPGRMPPLSNPPEPRPRESMFGGDDEFDYVSAYLNEGDTRQSGVYNAATNGYDHGSGGAGPGPQQHEGYGSGRFATRADEGF